MISKNLLKYIHSLEQKKGRRKEGLFVAEGPKVVGELIKGATPTRLIATAEWWASAPIAQRSQDCVVNDDELRKASFVQHPQQVIALFPIPQPDINIQSLADNLTIVLDGVQDPGNLGTIIRIADWFGISTIICSHDSADAYNPKVVQASMGSIARVEVVYKDLEQLFASLPPEIPVFGTFLDGSNIYAQELTPSGIIVMGNEGNGISPQVARHINRRLLIPAFPGDKETAESLNVAIATAITCAEFRRRYIFSNSVQMRCTGNPITLK
jgi:TrmH family RNA methyltransferase